MGKRTVLVSFFAAMAWSAAALGAEDKKTATDSAGPEPSDYMEQARAVASVAESQEHTVRDLQRFKIMIANFGSEVPGAQGDFDKMKDSFRQATEQYYLRHYVASSKLHMDSRKQADTLYTKFSESYRKQLTGLLAKCAQQLTDLEFSRTSEPGVKEDVGRAIQRHRFKLRIAYNQFSLAEDYVFNGRHSTAIDHYRLGKIFAIDLLKDMAADAQKKTELDNQFKKDLADANGRTHHQ